MFIAFMSILSIFLLISSVSLYFNIFKSFNTFNIQIRGFEIQPSNKNYDKKLKLLGKSDFFILIWCLFLIVVKLFFNNAINGNINILISLCLILSIVIDNYIFKKKIKNFL